MRLLVILEAQKATVPAETHFTKEDTIMALANIAGWAEENKAAAACGTACGASDKPAETPAACGAADKPAETPAACGAADKPEDAPAACGTACGAGNK